MSSITMYSTTWCGHCGRLARQLDDAGISYRVVNVEHDVEAGARIVAATGGARTVPTIEVDGRLLVNPGLAEVREALSTAARGN